MNKSDLFRYLDDAHKRHKEINRFAADKKTDDEFREKLRDLCYQIMHSMTCRDACLERGIRSIYELECTTIHTLRNQYYDTLIERHKFLEKSTLDYKYTSMEELINYRPCI